MSLSDSMLGNGRENIPNWAFRVMAFTMRVMDLLGYHDRNFKLLGVKKGQTVIDYGCGPARYTRRISNAIGNDGLQIATDIHPLALQLADRKILKYGHSNTQTVLSVGYSCPVSNGVADVVLALDMFHMIQNPSALLNEFARIVKPSGVVIIEDGHQSRALTRAKILDSGLFTIDSETKAHVRCRLVDSLN